MSRTTIAGAATPLMLAVALIAGCSGGTAEGPQEIRISVTEDGFVPAEVTIPKDKPVTLVVTRKTNRTCATEMVFAKTGAKHDLPLDQVVRIELPAGQPDTLRYACSMDMFRGTIVAK